MTRSDAFFDRLVERRPAIGHALGVLFAIGGICLMAAIMAGAWPKWLTAWWEGYYVGVIDVFTFPEWPLLLIIFIGCGLTALQFALLAVKSFELPTTGRLTVNADHTVRKPVNLLTVKGGKFVPMATVD